MVKVKFEVKECEDNVYESDSEGEGEMKDGQAETVPVILSCVGWSLNNIARAAL